jgi:hypothetical protein
VQLPLSSMFVTSQVYNCVGGARSSIAVTGMVTVWHACETKHTRNALRILTYNVHSITTQGIC